MPDYDPRDPTAPPMPPSFFLLVGEQARRDETAHMLANVRPSTYAPGSSDSQSLTRWQETAGRAWLSVEVQRSIYGWCVRASSGLDGFELLARTKERGGRLDGSFADALKWAREWCAMAPTTRYAYVREYDLSEDPIAQQIVKEMRLGKA